jgi:hypothetical protein
MWNELRGVRVKAVRQAVLIAALVKPLKERAKIDGVIGRWRQCKLVHGRRNTNR